MKTFIQYITEKVEMRVPSNVIKHDDDDDYITYTWTTTKGNRVDLMFDKFSLADGKYYDIGFSVNGSMNEDPTRSHDREIFQTILYQIKKVISERNDINGFTFIAYADAFDIKEISKIIKPYHKKMIELADRYKNDHPEVRDLYLIAKQFNNLRDIHGINSMHYDINATLSYKNTPDEIKTFLEEFKQVLNKIADTIQSGDVQLVNRRLGVYKKFMSQYLGNDWVVKQKGRSGILAKKVV